MLTGSDLGGLGAAAFAAGAINSLAGGGSLLTFPLLVALGLPPLTANVTNTLGHTPGYVSIVVGLREVLPGQRRRMMKALPATAVGAVAGAGLLTACSPGTFAAVAPVLVLVSAALLALGARRREMPQSEPPALRPRNPPAVLAGGVLLGSAYAAFFGAGAGFIVLATLTLCYADDLRPLNAVSRLVVCIANLVALPLLVVLNPVDLGAAAVMWPTTLLGGYLGARMSLRLRDRVLRSVVVTLALVSAVYLLIDR